MLTYDARVAFIIDDDNIARRRYMELGIENENQFEVIGGIDLGERIVIAGQSFISDGDTVRIVE